MSIELCFYVCFLSSLSAFTLVRSSLESYLYCLLLMSFFKFFFAIKLTDKQMECRDCCQSCCHHGFFVQSRSVMLILALSLVKCRTLELEMFLIFMLFVCHGAPHSWFVPRYNKQEYWKCLMALKYCSALPQTCFCRA